MRQLTVSFRDEQADRMESEVDNSDDYSSKSDYVRQLMDRHDSLENEVRELRIKNERLENEKTLILEQREEHTELVEAIQRDQTLSERKSHANILTRWKWKLTGIPQE